MFKGLASLLYDQRLQRTNFFSVEMRGQRAELVKVHKIMHGLEDLQSDLLFKTNLGILLDPATESSSVAGSHKRSRMSSMTYAMTVFRTVVQFDC